MLLTRLDRQNAQSASKIRKVKKCSAARQHELEASLSHARMVIVRQRTSLSAAAEEVRFSHGASPDPEQCCAYDAVLMACNAA